MKHMKTRLTALFAAAAMALSLAGCGSAASSTASASAAASGSGQQADYTVGILQYTSHSSLDEIAAAIQSELEQQAQAAGVTISVELKNGQGDAATINDICKMFVSDGVDLIIPIATPAATAAAAAVQGTDIPLVYSAVTDPVEAQLAQSMEAPGENMTGTSDYIDTAKILDLVLANNPDTKTLGLIYNLGETNSATTIEDLRPVLEEKGIQAVESTVTTPGEVQMAAQNLISQGVDAIFVPIDNTVASAMSVLADEAIKGGVPVYTAADSMVRDGGLATTGVNYTKLGELTAQMAVQVLQGEDPATMPVQVLNDGVVTVNTTTAAALGIDPDVFDLSGEGYVSVE
ncbi:ABC transporter substrate-binding protein [uncultured Allofournierella sp.]|uniref:ABC transporter substrate-binding protein n=1 Tax=uncultured Allofournierella sp. TaxID=1940258 RepID=UPI0025D66799|nr:ABC transporter substrate-binding protein [uncultured Fournierella sp.]